MSFLAQRFFFCCAKNLLSIIKFLPPLKEILHPPKTKAASSEWQLLLMSDKGLGFRSATGSLNSRPKRIWQRGNWICIIADQVFLLLFVLETSIMDSPNLSQKQAIGNQIDHKSRNRHQTSI